MLEVRKLVAKKNQKGVASIIVVTILIVLLSLISVGFAKLMSRTVNNSSNRQQNSAAVYAAQSGINEISSAIKKLLIGVPPHTVSDCNDAQLLPLLKLPLSTDPASPTSYSCNDIKPLPFEVDYQAIPPNRVQVIRLKTNPAPDQLLFSWQSSDSSKRNYPASGNTFYDETTWNSTTCRDISNSPAPCGPALRITLYPVYPGNTIPGIQSFSKTWFLYPNNSGSLTSIDYATTLDGQTKTVSCSNPAPPSPTGFYKTNPFGCNAIITNMSNCCGGAAPSYFYAVITPIYSQADVKILANSPPPIKNLSFIDTQTVIDVTGKSGNSLARLQVRVNTTQGASVDWIDNAVPDDALRAAKTICKRLSLNGSGVLVDGNIACGLTLNP